MNGMQLYQSHDMVKGEEIILKYAQKGETAKKKTIIKNMKFHMHSGQIYLVSPV